jgi:hypothetical protein
MLFFVFVNFLRFDIYVTLKMRVVVFQVMIMSVRWLPKFENKSLLFSDNSEDHSPLLFTFVQEYMNN